MPDDEGRMTAPAVQDAVGMQAANITQRAIIDNLTVKMMTIDRIASTSEGLPKSTQLRAALQQIRTAISMTKDEVAALRGMELQEFPDERVIAVIDKAVEDIVSILVPPSEGAS